MNINKVLDNKNFTIISSLLLAAYVGLINTNVMPHNLLSMVNTTIGKVVILVLIAYLGDKTPTVALMLAIALCVTLSLPSRETFFVDTGEEEQEPIMCSGLDEDKCTDDVGCSWDGENNQCGDKPDDTSMADPSMGSPMDPPMDSTAGNEDFSPSNAEVENFAPF